MEIIVSILRRTLNYICSIGFKCFSATTGQFDLLFIEQFPYGAGGEIAKISYLAKKAAAADAWAGLPGNPFTA